MREKIRPGHREAHLHHRKYAVNQELGQDLSEPAGSGIRYARQGTGSGIRQRGSAVLNRHIYKHRYHCEDPRTAARQVGRSGGTKQSRSGCPHRDCFASLAMTASYLIPTLIIDKIVLPCYIGVSLINARGAMSKTK